MAGKWMQAARKKMEKKGTEGSLREAGDVKKGEKLSPADLAALEKKARAMKGKDGKLTPEGLKLLRKVMFARNAMKK